MTPGPAVGVPEGQCEFDCTNAISKGIPAVTMSRGGVSGNSHSPDEWWQNVDGHIDIQIGLATLLAEAGLAR
jgi:hypothetical protein